MEGKIARCDDMLKIIHSNIIEESRKAEAVGFESKHPTIFTCTYGSQDSVDSNICTYVIEDFPRSYLFLNPITCSGLFCKHLHASGKLWKALTLESVA